METRHSFDQLGAPILPVIAAAGPSGWDNDVASSKFGGTVKQQLVDDPIPLAAGAFDWSANVPADDRRSSTTSRGQTLLVYENRPSAKRKLSHEAAAYADAGSGAPPPVGRALSSQWTTQHPSVVAASSLTRNDRLDQEFVPSKVPIPPPKGVEKCVTCGKQESPEWRKSERGVKEMCNACGLKLARQRAKEEGRQKPRIRKAKGRERSG